MLRAVVVSTSGEETADTIAVSVQNERPRLEILEPSDGMLTISTLVKVRGRTEPRVTIVVKVSQSEIFPDVDAAFVIVGDGLDRFRLITPRIEIALQRLAEVRASHRETNEAVDGRGDFQPGVYFLLVGSASQENGTDFLAYRGRANLLCNGFRINALVQTYEPAAREQASAMAAQRRAAASSLWRPKRRPRHAVR